ncbi:hypothetical protein PGTUg99_014071 [Puccinia graminis f. sp. tritici]|uniref:Uncharacterized protein n=1 Tax=Puccinia graminis f. sp. tritici TaxID=56615 RepID=A0A5B0RWS4_PUCGR|nr:hypothetical protein PGTUg99_014071 [Puccinia graminis f. sp. tritici]
MPIFGPNTLGTLVILLATIALIVVLASAPHHPNLYFLAATVSSKASNLNQAGIIKLGVFGYCISTEQGTEVCPPPSIGYALDPKVMFGLPELPEMIKLSDNIIRNMTKVLVLHVLGLAFISGLVSHIEEFSKTCWTSCFASIPPTNQLAPNSETLWGSQLSLGFCLPSVDASSAPEDACAALDAIRGATSIID